MTTIIQEMEWELGLLYCYSGPWLEWLSWLEQPPIDLNVEGLIPGQDTYTGCGFNPWSGIYKKAAN